MTNIVSFSGGLDSTATLLLAQQAAGDTIAVGFDYGQRHVRELESAARIANDLGVEYRQLDMQGLLTRGPSLLGSEEIPEGHYAEDSMISTVVLGRNLMFISALIGQADEGDQVWVGVHGGDHFVYPDCRPEFIDPLAVAVNSAYGVQLVAPFCHSGNKTDVVRVYSVAERLDIAALTWSCYQGGTIHCGRCGTCVERAEAFHLAGVADPTDYEDPNFWREMTM